VLFRHRVPRPPLDAFVEFIWVFDGDSRPVALERILPTGAAQLIVNLSEDQTRLYDPNRGYECVTSAGTSLSGIWSRYCVIDTREQERVAGVVFRPGGTIAFTHVPAHEIADADIDLECLWGRCRAAALRERLLESCSPDAQLDVLENALMDAWRPVALHGAVAFALTAFNRAPHTMSVAKVTDVIGLSAKRFIERFNREVGMTPKRYCRIRRFQRAVKRAHRGDRVDWTEVALDCGYFDQAHFIHDFRSFAGLTPTEYQAARTAFPNHVKFLQSDSGAI
jgi:AraC-like DNA-binding protein